MGSRAALLLSFGLAVCACGPSSRAVEPAPEPRTPQRSQPANTQLSTAAPAQAPGPPTLATRIASSMTRGGPRLELVARIPTGRLPKSVTVSPDGDYLFVCNFGQKNHGNVWRIDAHTLERRGKIIFEGIAVETLMTRDSQTLYVSSFSGRRIYEVDAKRLRVRRSFRAGINPKVMALSPDERLLYVANWSSNDISVIDLEHGKSLQRIPTGPHPRGMAVAADGEVFVNAMYAHSIHVFGDAPSASEPLTELRRFATCPFPRHSLFSPDESLLFVSCSGTNELSWYDPASGERRGAAEVGLNPRGVAMSSDGRYLAVADFDGGSVSLVDTEGGTFDSFSAPGADKIVSVAMQPGPGLGRIYATSWLSNELLIYEPQPEG